MTTDAVLKFKPHEDNNRHTDVNVGAWNVKLWVFITEKVIDGIELEEG